MFHVFKRVTLFIVIGFVALNMFIEIFPFSQSRNVASESIFRVIARSKLDDSSKILLIGDSVARQLKLGDSQSDYFDLTTNQAISLAGQFVLVQNALENNTNLEKIVLIYHPHSFNNNLDQEWTFNYFCKPFLNVGNYNTWSNFVLQQISKKPYWLVYVPLVRYTSLWGLIDYSNGSQSHGSFLSDISFDYLIKIDEISKEFALEFVIVAPPLSEASSGNIRELRMSVEARGLEELFRYYEKSVKYLPDSCFYDSIHIKSAYLDSACVITVKVIEQIY